MRTSVRITAPSALVDRLLLILEEKYNDVYEEMCNGQASFLEHSCVLNVDRNDGMGVPRAGGTFFSCAGND